MLVHAPHTLGRWLAGMLCTAGCQPSASSPLELAPPEVADGGARACLAATHPLLAHVVDPPVARLMAFNLTGAAIELGAGRFHYGSVWAPDGRSIAFRRHGLAFAQQIVGTDLALLEPDGGEEVVLLVDEQVARDGFVSRYPSGPSWSPDGREIAFASAREADHYRIWVMSRSGGQLRMLLPTLANVPHAYPSWSAVDAGQFAFVAEMGGRIDLWLADLGAEPALLTNLTEGQPVTGPSSPRWSPDGQRIAFSALGFEEGGTPSADARFDIFVIDVQSRKLLPITRNVFDNIEPAWSPDGQSLIISSTRPATEGGPERMPNLWRLTLDGSASPEPLTHLQSFVLGADWARSASCATSSAGP